MDNFTEYKTGLVKRLRELDLVLREPVQLKHGAVSEFYVDVKEAYGYPDALNSICETLGEMIDDETTCVAAGGHGGLSPATVLSQWYGWKLCMVRDEEKKHGKGGLLDGQIPTEDDVVALVDDVLTTGGSMVHMKNAIKPTGARVIGGYVVAKRADARLDFPVRHILTAEELM